MSVTTVRRGISIGTGIEYVFVKVDFEDAKK